MRTTCELGSASMPGTGSSAFPSRQFARVFSQKICAVVLPAFAAANKDPEIVALASATPRSSSSRKRLRSVFGAQPMIRAVGTLVERLIGGLMDRGASGEDLPAPHDDIDISRLSSRR